MSTFISYSRRNSDFAVRLAKDLKAAGLDVWLDQLDIPTGVRWDDEIEKALEKSSILLIILSPDSMQSQNVKDEMGYAIDAGKRILPVTVKNCNLPLRLRRFQYVDFSNKLYEDSLIDIKRLLTAPSNLVNENNPDHKATQFAEVSDKERKQQKQYSLSENKILIMLTIISLLFVLSILGLGLVGFGQMGIGPFGKKEAPITSPVTSTSFPLSPTTNPVGSKDKNFTITDVTFDVTREGDCESGYYFVTAHITSNGAGRATYHWTRSDKAIDTNVYDPLIFTQADTQVITTEWHTSQSGLWLEVYIDSPNNQQFGRANLNCP